jgi:2-polyprenyl-3-methyl-5-hydroxy-6-metoxy-1,4-benzoquinol methylase
MKIAGGQIEGGIVIGNISNKYDSKNCIVRRIISGFHKSLSKTVILIAPKTIHEVGCGEGHWVIEWIENGIAARGTDFSTQVIDMARANAREHGIDAGLFEVRSIYDVTPEKDSADLIVACEVFEHLEHPEYAFKALQKVVIKDLILSVPREPLWRALNILRGKYLSDFGNTPGHIQHYSKNGIASLVGRYFDIITVMSPFPWTMIHCRRKHHL